MKHLITLAALTVVFSAFAEPDRIAGRVVDQTTACRAVAEYGELLQEANQMGIPLADVVDSAKKAGMDPKYAVMAYKAPRLQNPDLQKKMIADFRDRMYIECLK